MPIRLKINGRTCGKRPYARLFALLAAFAALTACSAPTRTDASSAPSPAAAATATPVSALALTVVQTVHNSWTGEQTESVFTETVSDSESYTVKNMSGGFSLTFSIAFQPDATIAVQTSRPMLPHDEDGKAKARNSFIMERNTPCRIDDPRLDYIVWYTFTFRDPLSPTPVPTDDSVVQFHNRHIVTNIRRTLHESEKSAFTKAELELILFVELKGNEVSDIGELSYLPSLETLTLRNTKVTNLSSLSGCNGLRTLILLENDALDLSTLPPLPLLSTLSVTGHYTKEDILFLETLLPDCSIVAETED